MEKLAPKGAFSILHESAYAQPGGSTGGAAFVVRMQAETLNNAGHPIKIITPKNGEVNNPTIPFNFFEKPSVSNDELIDVLKQDEWQTQFETLLEDSGLIYAHYYVTGDVMAEVNERLNGSKKPLVYMGHSWDRVVATMDPRRKMSQIRQRGEQHVLDAADAIVVATEVEKALLSQKYSTSPEEARVIEGKTHVVPLGVDMRTFHHRDPILTKQWKNAYLPESLRDSANFFMLGRISPQKGHLEGIQAFSELVKQAGVHASLSVFGGPLEGPYFGQISEFLASQPDSVRERVLFHGVKPSHNAIASGDIFIGTSEWETWFLALTEAMAAGKPTIVSDKPILREVAGEGTLFVDEKNVNSIANAMHLMIQDPHVRRHSACYNSDRSKNYTWDNSVVKLRKVFNTIQK